MTDTIIKLGSFSFQGLEIPEKINFGGKQQLVQHDLIGGNRIIDSLGKNDLEISWSGLMQGSDALTRANQLNQMRVLGQQIQLTWFNLIYNVVISDFEAQTERYYQVAYTIKLSVISDGNNPINSQNLIGFNQAINNDLNNATTLSNNINVTSVTNSINNLASIISAAGNLDNASQSTILSIGTAVSNAISSVKSAITGPSQRLYGMNN